MFVIWNKVAKGYYTGEKYLGETIPTVHFEFVDHPEDAKQFDSQEDVALWLSKHFLANKFKGKSTMGIEIKEI